jgi:hypothetical protein
MDGSVSEGEEGGHACPNPDLLLDARWQFEHHHEVGRVAGSRQRAPARHHLVNWAVVHSRFRNFPVGLRDEVDHRQRWVERYVHE